MSGFLCLHIGAGYHKPSNEKVYKELCRRACKLGLRLLQEGKCSREVAVTVCCFLEDSELTNAGYGSNINRDGNVECDAAIMDSRVNQFSAVTCVQRLKNPVQGARLVLENQAVTNKFGLCPPVILSGEGVHQRAQKGGLPLIENEELKSPASIKSFQNYKRRISQADSVQKRKLSTGDHKKHFNKVFKSNECTNISPNNQTTILSNSTQIKTAHDDSSARLDTIGVICIDPHGDIVTTASSGGIAYKMTGRVGHLAQYGAGCWASWHNDTAVACCTSGCGELLMQTSLAKSSAELLVDDNTNLSDFIKDKFIGSPLLNSPQERLCGVLAVKLSEGYVDMHFAHTTESFCLAYSHASDKPTTIISRLEHTKVGKSCLSQGLSVKLNSNE